MGPPTSTWIMVIMLALGSSANFSDSYREAVRDMTMKIRDDNHTTVLDLASPCMAYNETMFPLCKIVELCLKEGRRKVSMKGDFAALCSGVLEQPSSENTDDAKPSSAAVWGYGFLCVTVISLTSVVGVGVLPFMSKSFYSSMLTCLIGLAVGSLSGSAIFHLIPSAFKLADVEFYEHHSYLNISFVVWLGIYMFFVIERLLKMFMEHKSRKQGRALQHCHSHHVQGNGDGHIARRRADSGLPNSNMSALESREPILSVEANDDTIVKEAIDVEFSSVTSCTLAHRENPEVYEQHKPAMKASFGHLERPAPPENRPTVHQVSKSLEHSHSPIATVAWMIIFGDGVHNFIDGLSIGAAFSESILTGISVSVAVLCEEFPHELGDFAVLLSSGMTIRQAMTYNFLSACTCYLGLVLGIFLGEMHLGNQYIFALAGGMFLYIALVDMVPELNETVDEAAKNSAGFTSSMFIFFLQNVGMLVGIGCLFVLAKYQDDIQVSL